MNEVFFKQDLIPAATNLQDPWELTYGPDDSLWVTEAKGFRVRKIHPTNGGMRTVLDLTNTSQPVAFRRQYTIGENIAGTNTPDPQGGLMGLAVHPDFMHPTAPKKFVYVAYVFDYLGRNQVYAPTGETVNGHLFLTKIVRFTYAAGLLGSPVSLCDTIRGSNDHNSGRLIIKPEAGVNYLYYACGDMGAGQFDNINRICKTQMTNSYEGKILRFNLEIDADAGTWDRWIPNNNPFNVALGVQSAVYAKGIRNNQGFAYDEANDRLYGSSHGPFSDDEVNRLENGRNYGHPVVIGYAADGNYNNAKAGPSGSSFALITSESANAAAIGASYMDPIFVNYPAPAGSTAIPLSVQHIYTNQFWDPPGPTPANNVQNLNGFWASEGYSGMGIYTNSLIPSWKNSLVIGSLKWGRIVRMRLNAAGTGLIPSDGSDTASYFGSTNRFRDVAISANGKDIFVTMDRNGSSSGPSANNPIVPGCAGCIQKYTFVGYYDNGSGASRIPVSTTIASGANNICETENTITINAANNNSATNIWVPITDANSNVIAEIRANGNDLGTVTTSVYKHAGAVREDGGGRKFLDRNMQISVQTQPGTPVKLRIYVTNAEYAAFQASGAVTNSGQMAIFKSNNTCNSAINAPATKLTTTVAAFGTQGYVLTADVPSFSSFYIANNALTTLPTELLSFTGNLNTNKTVTLDWKTATEVNVVKYVVERSLDGRSYEDIGTVTARNNNAATNLYSFVDADAVRQPSLTLYYRLRMVDIDESYKQSNIVTISLSDLAGRVFATPNPAMSETQVTITAAISEKGQWTITDNSGRIVMQSAVQLKTGNNKVTINISKLAAGIYYLNVKGGGVDERVKLQKL